MERNRITTRLRPRPYDLRRKVLLKNFFREQMTYIPHIRSTNETSLDADIDSDFVESESNSNTNDGNILTPKKVEDNIVAVKTVLEPSPSRIVTLKTVLEPAPSTSNCSEKENSNNLVSFSDETSSNTSKVDERPNSKFPRLARIMETIDSRLSMKTRRNGITKAKHELRSSKGILKPAGRKILKVTEDTAKVKAKSFFERFKSRRDKKRNKFPTSKISNLFGSRNSSPTKCDSKVATTSTQSVQTDMIWQPEDYEEIKQSNISLREENRLLSESLSSIITNTDFQVGTSQNSCCTDSYANSSSNSTTYSNSGQTSSTLPKCNRINLQELDLSRTRILRSKSMQNRSEKKNLPCSRIRTRSFNCRYVQKPLNNDSFVNNELLHCKRGRYRVNPIASPVSNSAKTRPLVLRNIDAPPLYNTNNSSLLRTFPNKSGKAIVRRTSMPEKMYNWNNKTCPVRSSSMRENHYSHSSDRVSSHPNQSSHHRRSSTFNKYSGSGRFQDLPVEAFF